MCEVRLDGEKMKVALLNIILNAVEAMETENGVLQLTTRQEDGKCIIEVRDNGREWMKKHCKNYLSLISPVRLKAMDWD